MRDNSSKTIRKVTRYRTPSSFKVRQAEGVKRFKAVPFHPPGRGRKTNIGRA